MRHLYALQILSVVAVLLAAGLIGAESSAAVQPVPLIPDVDNFGSQIETIQIYEYGGQSQMMFGIYDTGASVVTISEIECIYYELLTGEDFPVKVVDGAVAQGIGGDLVGDVSQPGRITADGLHAYPIDWSDLLNPPPADFSQSAVVDQVQAFVGKSPGSSALPTITGTPVHEPSAPGGLYPNGSAALIDMQAYQLDFGVIFPGMGFDGIVIDLPDLSFAQPGTRLPAGDGVATYDPVRVPMDLLGPANHGSEGDEVTTAPNPVQTGVSLTYTTNPPIETTTTVTDKTFLFDTGAQLSVMSEEIAAALGIDLSGWDHKIDVQGAAGMAVEVKGYYLDSLEMPCDTDNDGAIDDTLRFTDPAVYVLDLGVPGLDGILGMNLLNTTRSIVYDPYDPLGPSASFQFLVDRPAGLDPEDWADLEESLAVLEQLGLEFPMFGGVLSGSRLPGFTVIPEPSTLVLLAAGLLVVLAVRYRRRAGPQ